MKKLFYFLSVTAALAFAASCAKEADIDPVKGDLVETTFTVTLDDATATKATIGNNAALINKLLVRAFKTDGTSLKDLDGNFEVENLEPTTVDGKKQFSFKAKLVRNFPYKIAFFAINSGAPYSLDDDGFITMAAGDANDETLDAFYQVADVTLTPNESGIVTTTYSITLKRPLAQINILSDDLDWTAASSLGILDGLKSSITVKQAYTKLKLFDGTVDTAADLAFTEAASPSNTITIDNQTSHAVGTVYVFSSTNGSTNDVTFSIPSHGQFGGFTRTIKNVPVKRNYRTNLHGDLFTVSGDFTVTIDPAWGGNDDNQDINIPQPTITIPTTVPSGITATIPNITTGNNVTTTTAAGPLYFGINTNSTGDITYSSSDHNVGTIDNSGVFTPVGPGTTNITVTQAAGHTKADYVGPLAEITIVYHVTVEETLYDITFTAGENGSFSEIKLNGDAATLSENKISAAKDDVITFKAAPAENYEVDVVKVGETPLTATEDVYTYTVGEAAATISATFKAMGTVATPVFNPGTSYFAAGEQFTLTCETDGADIYYTTNGDTPTISSNKYKAPVNIVEGNVKAIAVKAGMISSAVAEATYTAKLATEIVLADQNMTFGGENITLAPVVKAGEATVDGATFTYAAGDNKVSVTNAGVVTASAPGESSVTINATVPEAYLAPKAKVVVINIEKGASSISWNVGSLEVTVGGSALDLSDKYTKTGSTGAVSFAIASGEDKAHLVGNTLVADAEGSVTINATVAADENYNGATTATAKTVTVNAAAVTKYDVIVDDETDNGTVSADKAEAAVGETVTLTVNPADYYELDALTVEDENNQAVTVTNNQFSMPEGGVTVTATFKKLKYAVNISTMTNGTVTVDETPAEWGATVILNVTPKSGYQLVENSLTVTSGVSDLTDVGNGGWAFTMPKNAVTVSAEFESTTPVYQYVGAGTAADPYTVADVRHFIDELGVAGTVSNDEVYVKGVIHSIVNNGQFNSEYHNASFIITEDGNDGDEFEAYRVKYVTNRNWETGDETIAVGDNVIICGKVKLYNNTTYETHQATGNNAYSGYLYSLNGKTEVTQTPIISGANNATEVPAGEGTLSITITSEDGSAIYYTTDGSDPTVSSQSYSAAFTINAACTIKAIAVKNGKCRSLPASQDFTKAGQGGGGGDVTDEITYSKLAATSTTYTDFSNVSITSDAKYAGNSAKDNNNNIQLRSKNSNSGIVSTVSGGKVKSVTITVGSGTNTIDVYGSNTAYTNASDLYATGESNNQGTKIGSLTATGTITFTSDYEYVGIRSNNGAVYISKIEIVWE